MTEAIENARSLTTSPQEKALTVARLLHSLGEMEHQAIYERIANLRTDEDPYSRSILTPKGQITAYVEREDGDAETPEGRPCLSYAQQIEALRDGQGQLWLQAEEDKLSPQVAEELQRVKDAAVKKARESLGE